ncbi:RnfABCDGE type electron transport complex subunit D [Cloacibacillus evryensis]|uniref:Ion-translocating oxidoreductase complex subunit D n=1 Tax=Cloacibacillus evryensis TaxID=508460 RepID=A0AAW5K1S6_9BACT|nr:RnfABCDGE type electron transport complex subunit D [Cloacibacillus evryensis]EHL71471.1 electron transport complex, rnfabcdge type, D subunit [Synergistes sp. 3_1_syn1]MCQ4813646.1 RnfABCDGE type electron transport complex subunit D [Cloacibacillus evryensis]MEA5033918.1 RnfABCDGE type electron transport complex subunit D [Cloacibacillus evryensis]
MERLLVVSSSPHIHSPLDTRTIMGWVLAALAPAGIAGVYFFGLRAAAVMAVCVVSCVAFEYLWERCTKRTVTVGDLSAAVTGLLLAYNLPPTIPFWMAVLGSLFAIIVVKQFFGGLGCNIVNPALAGRAMMLTSWPVPMTTWTLDGVSGATPLAMIKAGTLDNLPGLRDVFLGSVGGCIGETSALALLIGFAILLYKDIIKWHVPVIYVAVVAALCALFGRPVPPYYEILTGGLFLGAIFMATDYTTTPITLRGQMIFAAGCGLLTALIRTWGGYPEGVSYSILIMNLTVPLIDRATKPRIFGEVKKHG